MGSKQSKRSVDISGKEGEAAVSAGGYVVAAGGEGRVEPIADIDNLKPQLNGDAAHIEPPKQIADKEKKLANATPENEKDTATEKEAVVTNGSGEEEQKTEQENGKSKTEQENGKSKTAQETDKKDKKETEASVKVEAKSSDEAEKVEENKSEKTPETPVTEPITNGSSTPQTPSEEASIKEASPAPEKSIKEVKVPTEPEKLAVNGLSIEDKEEKQEAKSETKAEEAASTPDLALSSEVCVGQSQASDTCAPPPLPDNPPPSSLTAFAETTMAPHLVDAPPTDIPAPVTNVVPASQNIEEEVPQLLLETPEVDSNMEIVQDTTANVTMELLKGADETKVIETDSLPISIEIKPVDEIIKIETERSELTPPVAHESHHPELNMEMASSVINSEFVEENSKPVAPAKHQEIELTNGDEVVLDTSPSTNGNGEIHSGKINRHIVESESPSESSNPMIDEVPQLPVNGIKSDEIHNGDESNEASESFPAPPSDLCHSSEGSAPPSPQPQDSAPLTENLEKTSGEINPDKIADLKEAACATLAAAEAEAGAGDGAPSDYTRATST